MKNKLVMIVLGVILVLAAGAMVYAIYSTQSGKEVFAEDGYIIVYDESDAEQPAKTYHFTEGTAFKRSYEGSIQFRDTEGKTVTADANSFVHYDSGASASLSKSVLVNLDEVGSSAVNYYGLNADTSVNRSGSSYSIDTSDSSSVDLTNYLWKVGNNRYMMVSDVITVSFADGESYTFDDYVELIYQEGGMVSIINGDTMLRDASKNTYVSTDTGIKINLATQVVLDNDNIAMTLGQMTTDSDQVVSVLPADVDELKIIIPEFNFTVIDGKNGEAGPDGRNGADGADGSMGTDGLSGDNGRTGLMGYDGDDGDAGQAGTSGRSGVNGVEGAQGVDGASGSAGSAGPQGGQGAAGSAGSAGGAGSAGAAGTQGPKGDDGRPGDVGNNRVVTDTINVLKDVPMIYWKSGPTATYSEIKGGFGFKMTIDEATTTLVYDVVIDLIDLSTGKLVRRQEVTSPITTSTTSEITQLTGFENLTPGKSYRLRISGAYDYSDKKVKVETVFDDRTIVMDDFPLNVVVYNVEYNKIDLELINRDAKAKPGDTRVQNTYNVTWELVDANGEVVNGTTDPISVNIGATTPGVIPTVINGDGSTSDHLVITQDTSGTPIKSDSQYYFTVKSIAASNTTIVNNDIPARYIRIPVRTLKKTPQIADVDVTVNILNQSFDFSVRTVTDPDQAITGFRYEVIDQNDKIVKTVWAPNSDITHCYVDGTDLNPDDSYRVRAVAEAFDGRKNIEVVCDYPDRFTMNGVTQYTWFTLDNKDQVLYPNALGMVNNEAKFSLHIPARAGFRKDSSVRVVYHSSEVEMGSVTVGWQGNWESIRTGTTFGTQNERVYSFMNVFSNLKASTTYKFDAYAEVDLTGDGIFKEMLVGTVMLTTPKYVGTKVDYQGGNSNTNPIYFSLSLQNSGTQSGPNTSQYAVSQVGSKSTVGDFEYLGGVHVQLLSPDSTYPNDPSMYTLVCEGDIPMTMEGQLAVVNRDKTKTKNEYITLDDFPGNPQSSSFNGNKYIIRVTGAYDSTSHKNPIDVTWTDKAVDIGKSYPDPSSMMLDVKLLTPANISLYVNNYNAPENMYSDTVLGFLVQTNSFPNLNYFDRISYYVYDSNKYDRVMAPIASKLKSSNPSLPDNEISKVSADIDSNGDPNAEEASVAYFYPNTDTNYMARVDIDLKKGTTGSYTYMGSTPAVIFLFDDFTGDKDVCESAVKTRNTVTGYGINVSVGDDADNRGFDRGRDYEFTFRLRTNVSEMQETRMYPEVLGDDKAVILKCATTCKAPYESPAYHFYPLDNDDSCIIYGYYIRSVDAAAILRDSSGNSIDKMTTSTGTIKSQTKANYTNHTSTFQDAIITNEDAVLKVSDLHENDRFMVSFSENLYVDDYNRGRTVTAFTKLFTGRNGAPTGTFTAATEDDYSRVRLDIKFGTAAQAKSVAAVVGTFQKNGTGTERDVICKISSVTETDMVAYVQYADLSSIANAGDTVTVRLTVYYDTGREGLLESFPSDWAEENTTYVAVREAGEDNLGQYIVPLGEDGMEFSNRGLQSQDIRAEGSIFRIAKTSAGAVGAQNIDIAGSYTGDPKPGVVNVILRHWQSNEPSSWYYALGENARARLGGMYDPRITKSLLPFTVSLISSTEGLRTTNDGTFDTFTLGSVIPQVNLHAKTGYTISAGVNDATVTFKISGVKGETQMYGRAQSGAPYGNVYVLLYTVEKGTYKPVLDNGKIKRYEVPLNDVSNANAPGDGTYSCHIDQLLADTNYAVQLVYYKDVTGYNADVTYDENGNITSNARVYLPDEMNPNKGAASVYYPVNTTQTIQVNQNEVKVAYDADGYFDKELVINYALSGSTTLKPEEQFVYALYNQDGKLVLTHKELQSKITENYGRSFSLNVSPDTLLISKSGSEVYLNFSGGDGDVTNYKLRMVPIKKTEVNSFTKVDTAPESLIHGHDFQEEYDAWLKEHSLSTDHTNDANQIFADFKDVKPLASPFYNIRAYAGVKQVGNVDRGQMRFRVSVVDPDGVVYQNNYMIRVYVGGEDKTPDAYDNAILSTTTTQSIEVDNLDFNTDVTLKVYAIEDKKNSHLEHEINHYTTVFGTDSETSNSNFSMNYTTERTTGANGFSAGTVEAVRMGASYSAYVDFVNPSNIAMVKEMVINVVSPGSSTRTFTLDRPFADLVSESAVVREFDSNGDKVYRCSGIDQGVFSETGTYTIAIRMKVEDNSQNVEEVQKVINFTIV